MAKRKPNRKPKYTQPLKITRIEEVGWVWHHAHHKDAHDDKDALDRLRLRAERAIGLIAKINADLLALLRGAEATKLLEELGAPDAPDPKLLECLRIVVVAVRNGGVCQDLFDALVDTILPGEGPPYKRFVAALPPIF